jgi:hypothetical protein
MERSFYHNEAARMVRSESIDCSTTGKGNQMHHTLSLRRRDVSASEAERWSGPVGEHERTFYGDPQAKAQELYELHHGTKDKEGWVEINADEFDALSKKYADEYAIAQKEKR